MYEQNYKVYREFDDRLARIDRGRSRMVHGYKAVVAEDGLIIFRAQKPRSRMPVGLLMTVLLGWVAFKSLVLFSVGPEVYEARVAALQDGTAVEQLAAKVLGPDIATRFVVAQVKGLIG